MQIFEKVVMAANDAVVITDASSVRSPVGPRIVFVNPAYTRLTGYTPREAIGRTPRLVQGPGTSAETRRRIAEALGRREAVRVEILNYAKGGRPYWCDLNIVPLADEAGRVTHFAAVERDVTPSKAKEFRLLETANTDFLTGLPNRRSFFERADVERQRAKRYVRPLSLLIIDIDHFKRINDEYGHHGGDQVLVEVAHACNARLRPSDLCARIGGEEFALLLPETGIAGACALAERIRGRIEGMLVQVGKERIGVTVSIGVATLSQTRSMNVEELLSAADAALYDAKRRGRNRVTCGDSQDTAVAATWRA